MEAVTHAREGWLSDVKKKVGCADGEVRADRAKPGHQRGQHSTAICIGARPVCRGKETSHVLGTMVLCGLGQDGMSWLVSVYVGDERGS